MRAPQITTSAAAGRRTSSGTGTNEFGLSAGLRVPVALPMSTPIQSAHRLGAARNDALTTRPVTTSAVDSGRHSRRTANHSKPTPGVTLVSSTNDHDPACRKPTTIAAARKRWTLPSISSTSTGGARITSGVHLPAQ